MGVLKVGNKNRSKENTSLNENSSRSHAIMQIQIDIKERGQGIQEQVKTAKFSIVDLAGAERGTGNNPKAIRQMEGAKINQSLLCLGNCIQALSQIADKNNENAILQGAGMMLGYGSNANNLSVNGISGNNNKIQQQQQFVPYRGSKLTRILKESIGGNCRTIMIATVSPAAGAYDETYSTLMYAYRAQNIRTNATRNVLNVNNHVSNYAQIVENLKKDNENLKKIIAQKNNKVTKQEPS